MKPVYKKTEWVIKTRIVDPGGSAGVIFEKPYRILEWQTEEIFLILNEDEHHMNCGIKWWEDYSYEENLKKILE